ncbi:MAG: hypothetical protein HKO57_00005, partial [Akkermansiaceae bacterium]|nr:hypothetical protein [Akkermansiaceae bacterium]
PYAAALILTHYHLASPERREALRKHLAAAAAHRDRRKPRPVLASPAPEKLEELLARYWSSHGIRLVFR